MKAPTERLKDLRDTYSEFAGTGNAATVSALDEAVAALAERDKLRADVETLRLDLDNMRSHKDLWKSEANRCLESLRNVGAERDKLRGGLSLVERVEILEREVLSYRVTRRT